MTPELSERLAVLRIRLLMETGSYAFFTRDNFLALVERRGSEFGGIGSTGMLTGEGIAYLIWRDGQAFLVAKGRTQPATAAEIADLRRFSADLARALHGPGTAGAGC